jgi:hypothetical protein
LAALAVVASLAANRYLEVARGVRGADYGTFLNAARNVANGSSPYGVSHYVYPPTLAVLLAPFSRIEAEVLWKWWVALMLVSLLVGVAAFVASETNPSMPHRAMLFALCSFSVLCPQFIPVRRDLHLGQTNPLIFPILMLSACAASRGWSALRGACIGLAALLKTWPAVVALSLWQRHLSGRKRSLLSLLSVVALGPMLIGMFGVEGGIVAFVHNNRAAVAESQSVLINDSVWPVARMLFSAGRHATPLYVSPPLCFAAAAVLFTWVVSMLLVALHIREEPALCTWHVITCAILLFPESHRQYAIFMLPLLWCWAARWLGKRERPLDPGESVALGAMVLWWLVQCHAWPYTDDAPTVSAVLYSVPFFANLVAGTVSITAARAVI